MVSFETVQSFPKILILDPAVSLQLQDPIPRPLWDSEIWSQGFNATAESDPAVSLKPQKWSSILIETEESEFANDYLE
jgi:hypothetical protein